MIYILHGDDIVSSRNRITELSSEFPSVNYFDAEKASISEIISSFSSTDLFLDKKCIVIEKILRLSKSDLEKVQGVILDSSKNPSTTVILWHNTELSKIFLSKFKTATVEVFLLPKLFFTFLDSLTPKTASFSLDTLSKMKNVEAEQIFYSMIKRVRQLLMIKSSSNIEEIEKMSPWQKDKLRIQSSKWRIDELEVFYRELFKLEVKMKSGGLMLPLKKHLDILLVSGLN